MDPADNQVATIGLVPVVHKAAAGKLKFNADALPPSAADLVHGFTIGKLRLDPLHHNARLRATMPKTKITPASLVGS